MLTCLHVQVLHFKDPARHGLGGGQLLTLPAMGCGRICQKMLVTAVQPVIENAAR